MSNKLNFVQCNIQSVTKNKDELHRTLIDKNYAAAFLSETWTQTSQESGSKYNIAGYNKFINSRYDNYGGSAIYLRKDLAYIELDPPLVSDFTQIVIVKLVCLDLVMVSIYISPQISNNNLDTDLKSIFQNLTNFSKVIVAGDFNAHSTIWGNDFQDSKGEIVLDNINGSNLILLNDQSKTFIPIQNNRNPTAIDLTLATANIYNFLHWKTTDNSIGSHHLLIEFTFDNNTQIIQPKFVYNHKKIRAKLAEVLPEDFKSIEDLQKIVLDTFKQNQKISKYTPKYWWSAEVEKAWQEKNLARSIFNKTSSLENLIDLKKKQALFNKLKKDSKQKHFQNFVNNINPQMNSSELWLKINRLTGKKSKIQTNNIIYENENMANSFLEKHFGLNDPINLTDEQYTINYNLLTIGKFNSILNTKKRKSSPGDDKISYELLKIFNEETKINIVKLLNAIWRDCYLPISLKTITIVAIPKPGKNQNTIDGKRPISLVPTLTKIMNSAVLEKIQSFLYHNNILPDTSFGFRKNSSTITCINYLVNTIKENKRQNYVTACIFLDLSNAFNAVVTDKLVDIMHNNFFPAEISSWVSQFLKNRKIIFNTRTGKIEKFVSNGLPQGDVLSPTLFNIYTSNLHKNKDTDVVLVQYADDFGIVVRAKNLECLNHKMQTVVDNFCHQMVELNFKINPDKTKIILFQNSNNLLNITINNINIENVRCHLYLGVTLDKYLSFGIHIKNTKSKIVDRLNMIKVINSLKFGAHPQTMITIYKSIFRSIIEYGSTIFNNSKKTNRKILETTNNTCLRKITGCTKTTPLNSLMAISAQQPIALRHEYIASKEIARIVHHNSIILNQLNSLPLDVDTDKLTYLEGIFVKYRHIFEMISPCKPIVLNVQDRLLDIYSSLDMITTSKKNMNPMQLKQAALCVMNGKFQNRPRIFTDASKDQNTCGIGIYNEYAKSRYFYKLQNETSIATAELIAISEALKIIEQQELNFAVIYTDSRTACLILEEALISQSAPQIIVEIINRAIFWKTSIQWIPSHVQIAGNEIADCLAKHSLTESVTKNNQILIKDAFWKFKHILIDNSNFWYQQYAQEKGKLFFEFQDKIEAKAWFFDKQLSNEQTRLLNRLLTGHNFSKFWKAKMKIVQDENCDLCNEPETGDHIILHCPKYGRIRSNFTFDCKFRNLLELFKTKNLDFFIEVTEFLKMIKVEL